MFDVFWWPPLAPQETVHCHCISRWLQGEIFSEKLGRVKWVFPKIVGFPPKSSILIGIIGFSWVFHYFHHPFWGVSLFSETSKWVGLFFFHGFFTGEEFWFIHVFFHPQQFRLFMTILWGWFCFVHLNRFDCPKNSIKEMLAGAIDITQQIEFVILWPFKLLKPSEPTHPDSTKR